MSAALLILAIVMQQPPDTVVLKPIVVTATRVPTPADAVSAAVTVIRGTSLRERGIRTVAEALRETLGAAVVETGGGFGSQTSLFVRGGESDYVKVLLDGVPLNQPGGAYNFAHLTTDDVERIEIVRGPVSVLYGSDAVAGVVQIFTRTGVGAPHLEVEGGGGGYGVRRLGGTVAGSAGPIGYSVGVSRFTSDGLFPINNQYRNGVVTARVRAAIDGRSDAALTVRHGDGVFHYPTDGAGRIADTNQFASDRGPAVSLDAGRRLSHRVEARLLLGWSESDGRVRDDPDGPGDTTGVYSFHSRDRVRRRSAELRTNVHGGTATVLTGGVALEDARLQGTNDCEGSFGGVFDCSTPPIDVTRSTHAVFLQALTGGGGGRGVAVNVGARVEDNQQFGTFATWRAGVAWRLDDATRLRASAGSGFKDPTLLENYSRSPFATGNPDLRPERSLSWEAGIEHAVPRTTLSVAVTYFDQRFRDVIVYDFSRTPNYFNGADARANGAEIGVQWVAPFDVRVTLNYTYLETRVLRGGGDPTFETAKRLIRRPTNAATLGLASRFARRGAASLAVRFVGDRDDLDFSAFPSPRVTLHPYTRVNASVEYAIFSGRGAGPAVTLEGRVDNILDDRGPEVANFPVRGRSLFLGGRLTP